MGTDFADDSPDDGGKVGEAVWLDTSAIGSKGSAVGFGDDSRPS